MSLKHKIEVVLFISAKALSLKEIADILSTDQDSVEEAILDLIMDYSARDTALEIDDEDGYMIQVKEEYDTIVRKLVPLDMSQGALKTLSAIAIKNSILQSELIDLIGPAAYDHVSDLVEKGFIIKKQSGRSFKLQPTEKFYEYFKLSGNTQELQSVLKGSFKNKTFINE